ncbi:glycoside hydrolase 43 family protein [Chitinophagaceae bacterium LB-8]|uniref:Glycoside hydrolase 43 family protein n=1 Tax=Paraflavisolibacter caeni TaxID=2982496 RepID=A0A9X2XU84_9BACT|nr:glycoside hydrolase 43 family protein [Paraflavisolibacter caeni]MCU7548680.1 glycoside hydrolase 43 family protein [Paraflavisolibacter caeni]
MNLLQESFARSKSIKGDCRFIQLLCIALFLCVATLSSAQKSSVSKIKVKDNSVPNELVKNMTWTSDNGNGTFTNPLFYDEFSDPDLIRVGDDYYLTGTTMHTMPGLPVLHSKDLVNWEFLTYAADKLDFGPEFRLENGRDIYGQGIWAPSFRYHKGKFYIFSNVNRYNTHLYTATDPKGPWTHTKMNKSFHDLSVLFDDDGKVYVVWGYDEVRIAELNDELTDTKPGTEQVIVPRESGAGEGCHFYKINGKYYITNTNYDPLCYQVCLRADQPTGPYEINVMSAEESLGIGTGYQLRDTRNGPPFNITKPTENFVGCIPMHQGGIVQTQSGEWWGWSMMDHNSIGRLVCLSPVTWQNGWPYFGLPGNLTRSPRTWVKPNTGFSAQPKAPYERSDDFSGSSFKPIWQWNHVPVDGKWSLTARKGYLRLQSLPAKDFWSARNSLTQRAVGPESIVTTEVDVKGLKAGDVAGFALLNLPYAWIGLSKNGNNIEVQQFNQQTGQTDKAQLNSSRVWLRADCNFDTEKARFSYSTDGTSFQPLGEEFIMVFQLRTFQGVRFALFNYNTAGVEGGYADFNDFIVTEPRSKGLTRPIPYGKSITLTSLADSTVLVNWKGFVRPVPSSDPLAKGAAARFRVVDRGNGRIALQSEVGDGFVTVKGMGSMAEVRIEKEAKGDASVFQWQDMLRGDLMLMSMATHRYLFADPGAKSLTSADAPGTRPDRKDGACFGWTIHTP